MSNESEIDFSEWEQASPKKMMSYSLGFLISTHLGGVLTAFVFFYYEVEVGLPVVLLGLAFIIFTLWNMVNDPLIGYLTDRPFRWTKKWGMRFPWILIGGFPMLICWFFLFTSPDIDPDNPWPVFWYFIIVSCLMDTFYSLYTTHLNAGYTTHFRSDAERRRMSAISIIFNSIMALPLGFILPIFYVYGDRSTAIFAQLIIVIILGIFLIFTIPGIRESKDLKERFLLGYETTGRLSYWKTMKMAFQQRSFVISLTAGIIFMLGWLLHLASWFYFVKDILRMPFSVTVYIRLATFFGFTLSVPLWIWISTRLGIVKALKLGILLAAIALTPLLWISTLEEAIIYSFLGGVALGGGLLLIGPVNADVNDDFTVTAGKHQEGILAGIRTFFYRFIIIFQAIILTMIHVMTGYNPDPRAVQTPLAIWGIRVQMGLIPSLLALVAFLFMYKLYDL